jgi:radical SAM protein with 4Fe4S-binding SPASM domain
MNYYDSIGWVDDYVKNLRPYIKVRAEDGLLIKIPNQTYKLNPQGVKVLAALLGGAKVYSIVDSFRDRESVARDIHYFCCDLRHLLSGNGHDVMFQKAVEEIPFGLGFNKLPVLSEIALTYRCNLKCRFCYAGCGENTKVSPELSTAQLSTLLDMIFNEAQVPSVSFTGGEPTLRPDLPELVKHAKKTGFWVNLITNGTLVTKELAVKLKDSGLDSAQVSVEAGNAGLHDPIAAVPGSFERTMSGIENIRDAGIRVHTNTTISALNRNALEGIVDMVKRLGLDKLSMNMLMPAGSAITNIDETFISYTDIGPLVESVKRAAERAGLEFMWYSPTPVCIFNPVEHGLGNKGCAACDGLLSVAPNGDVLPCSSYPKPMGNMLENKGKFGQLWHSEGFRHFQRKEFAHDDCKKCEKLAMCNGGCPLYWQKTGYAELYNLKKQTGEKNVLA